MVKNERSRLAIYSFWLLGIIIYKQVQVLHYIVLQQRIELIEVGDDAFQSWIIGGVNHFSFPGLKPSFIYTIGKADHFDKAVVGFAEVCFNPALKRAAQFKPFCKFSLRNPKGFANLDYSFIDLILFFSQMYLPSILDFIKKHRIKQESHSFCFLTMLFEKLIIVSMKLFEMYGLSYGK